MTDRPLEAAPAESGRPLGTVLLERTYAGLTVEVSWHKSTGPCLFVRKGEEPGITTKIGEGEALEAFEHPYLFLQRAGLA